MKRQLTVAAFALFLMVAGASAHEVEVMYDRREPVELAIHYQKMTTVAFWDVISTVSTTVPATVLDIRKDPMFPHTITIVWGNIGSLLKIKDGNFQYFSFTDRLIEKHTTFKRGVTK